LFKSKGLPSGGKEKENWCDLATIMSKTFYEGEEKMREKKILWLFF